MRRVLFDTNVYSALMAGDQDIAGILSGYDAVLISPVVVGELLDGFRGGRRERENREILDRFAGKPRSVHIPVTDTTAEWFAEIKAQLKRKGKPIPINDVWIAASCMEHGAYLFSPDRHFDYIDGLLRTGGRPRAS